MILEEAQVLSARDESVPVGVELVENGVDGLLTEGHAQRGKGGLEELQEVRAG